jgi:hypothetical protein
LLFDSLDNDSIVERPNIHTLNLLLVLVFKLAGALCTLAVIYISRLDRGVTRLRRKLLKKGRIFR